MSSAEGAAAGSMVPAIRWRQRRIRSSFSSAISFAKHAPAMGEIWILPQAKGGDREIKRRLWRARSAVFVFGSLLGLGRLPLGTLLEYAVGLGDDLLGLLAVRRHEAAELREAHAAPDGAELPPDVIEIGIDVGAPRRAVHHHVGWHVCTLGSVLLVHAR